MLNDRIDPAIFGDTTQQYPRVGERIGQVKPEDVIIAIFYTPRPRPRRGPLTEEDRKIERWKAEREAERIRMLTESPADAARRAAVARELGIKPSQVTDLKTAERIVQARRVSALMERYPAIGRAFNQRPPLAGYLLEHADELATLGGAFKALLTRPPRAQGGVFDVLGEIASKARGSFFDIGFRRLGKIGASAWQEYLEAVLPGFVGQAQIAAGFRRDPAAARDAARFAEGARRAIAAGRAGLDRRDRDIANLKEVYSD
jgi:hypothetical protein